MQLGVIGLGTMGANLARNAARNGAKVVVYNRTAEKTEQFINNYGSEGDIVACTSYKDFVEALTPPRPILIMVKAGPAVDSVLEDLLPILDKGDVLIDGGNSYYHDTDRRTARLSEQGYHFVGMGVSGGEEGALNGPSMMPGGDKEAYETIQPLLQQMAAEDGENGTCISYLGSGGAGHFVKTVHNGIEYGIMQLIAESYHLLKEAGNFTNEQLHETFQVWSESDDLKSFLTEITAQIFTQKDGTTDADLIDVILDKAKQKGTGKWTTQAALDYGVAVPTITAAVDARIISGSTDLRQKMQKMQKEIDEHDPIPRPEQLRFFARCALELSIICSYAQGMELIKTANEEEGWNVPLGEVARIWRGGCIIRSTFLRRLQKAYGENASEAQAAKEAIFERFGGERQLHWRQAMLYGVSRGIPMPATAASLAYFDALRHERLPQNLIQAQRDFFGAHTYERTDKEGSFHTHWTT